ncbi:ABC-2 transporter permease [Staphylococcus caledonicus]|uniref:phenol-soluble modulin export ABC transporter permease subunit PmtB n=1 Tax=Staphylococcus sp. acrmy TaxID=2929076 RepID=UPI001F572B7E|nr:ABC-2 transporter permease [Staphylococcus sp. acrmy]MCI2948585.1 ABC-2 transporter permease [Staphylococcus sp. acrmy]
MKQLLIRNLKLRSWTIALYLILLVIYPLYVMVLSKLELKFLFYTPIAITLMLISILDSGHLFRINRRLGGKTSYLFYESLPVSKKDMLNANYISCIVLTLIGAIIIGLYNFQAANVEVNSLRYSTMISFIAVHFLSIPIAFNKNTEKKREYISYTAYIILMMLVIPFAVMIIFSAINSLVFKNEFNSNLFMVYLNYGVLILSAGWMAINYLIQLKRIKKHTHNTEGGF